MKNDTLVGVSMLFHGQMELPLIALDIIVDGGFVERTRDCRLGEVKAVRRLPKRCQMTVGGTLKEYRSLDLHGAQVSGAIEKRVVHTATTPERKEI